MFIRLKIGQLNFIFGLIWSAQTQYHSFAITADANIAHPTKQAFMEILLRPTHGN